MKKLILPISILLITASCAKQELPAPVSKGRNGGATLSTARVSNDTLVRITVLPLGRGPWVTEKIPVIKK